MEKIESILSSPMENLNKMVDVNKVIGAPFVTPEGATVIPVSQIAFGFATGGGETEAKDTKNQDYPFFSASGAGVTVKPNGFLVISGENVRFLPVQKETSYDRLIELVPTVMDKVRGMVKPEKDEE